MSASKHPIALRLEGYVGGATKLLATVMALPLVDGIFAALVLTGALSTPVGIIETGLLIFGGSATMAVILAEMDGTRRQQVGSVLLIGALVVPVAAAQAAVAPTLDSLLNLDRFRRFAGLVILAIAAKTASSKVGEILPSPGVIIVLGLVGSFDPAGVTFKLTDDPFVVARGAAAAAVGVAFALGVALASPQLRGRVDIDRFRFGSAVALGVLALPILGVLRTDAPIALAVLTVTALFAYDPEADPEAVAAYASGDDDGPPAVAPEDAADAADGADGTGTLANGDTPTATGTATSTDGAGPVASRMDGAPASEVDRGSTPNATGGDDPGVEADGEVDDGDEREPWL